MRELTTGELADEATYGSVSLPQSRFVPWLVAIM